MNGNAVKSVRTAYKIIRLVFIVLAVVFILLFLIFCRVKADKISISGNIPLDGEKVLSASGITEGTHLYAIDKNEIESGIVSAFSYISSVRIKRSLPCSLNIYIYKEIPAFVCEYNDGYIILNKELRIIEITKSPEEAFTEGAVPIALPEIGSCALGDKIVFTDNSAYSFCINTINTFYSSELGVNITSLNISSKFGISILYNNSYTVVFGTYIDLESKVNLVSSAISRLSVSHPGASGTVYALQKGEASFVPD